VRCFSQTLGDRPFSRVTGGHELPYLVIGSSSPEAVPKPMRGATENRLVEQIQELRSRTNFQDALESDQWPETEVPVNEHWLAQGKDLPAPSATFLAPCASQSRGLHIAALTKLATDARHSFAIVRKASPIQQEPVFLTCTLC